MRRKKKTRASAVWFRIFLVLVLALTGLAAWLLLGPSPAPAPPETTQALPAPTLPVTEAPAPETTAAPVTTAAPEPQVTTVSMVAVGDNLIHNMVYRSGWGFDPWNYDHLYQYVKDDIQAADIAVINQETMFVSDHANVSNYPTFGTPREIGDAVYKAGFDVILNATNHVMDKGVDNIYDAIDYWSDKDVTVLGIHKSAEDAALPAIVEVNGIRIGMINYVYGLNGFQLPADQSYAVDLLTNQDKLLADIAYLEENADITVGFLHVGTEYSVVPTESSRQAVELCVAAGADLLINAHPHVLEPYERYTAQNGNQAVVYYSLGNFISAQTELDNLLGGMATVTIQKTVDETGTRTEVTDFDLIPLVTQTAYDDSYAVYKLEDYNDSLGARNVLCPLTTDRLWRRFYEIVGEDS